MHTLVLKTDDPKRSYRLSKVATKMVKKRKAIALRFVNVGGF